MPCTYPDCECAISFPAGHKPSEATECPKHDEMLVEQMLKDLLDAVSYFYGQEGLCKVVDHMKRINRARENNAEIDALAATFEGH